MTAGRIISSQRNQNNLAPSRLPKELKGKAPAETFETAEDMAFVELTSPVSGGGDAWHIAHGKR